MTDLPDRDELKELRRIPPGESDDEARARVCALIAAKLRLDEASRGSKATHASCLPPSAQTVERRAVTAEVRAKGRRLEGYAATFGAEAKILDYTETIRAGAFAYALAANKDILALVDHDAGKVLARTKSGTLRLLEDSRGLAFDLDVPPTQAGNDVLALAERGDLGGASFAFIPMDERWEDDRRELRSVDLKEISVVSAWPAYEGTIVQARSRPALHYPRVAVVRRYLETL